MGDVVSLKLHRKRKDRSRREEQAAENRARFGRAKDQRALTDAEKAIADKNLDGHKRDE